ncbi:MAG: murein biosynthesis integral membrane protein MurJ [Burkholderiales bacterium]|nr:murein biosynthesis integral membrane protein MurJ [Burkholderiales bacterium]MDE1928798.1 murein biosynthesis integral membrane protein MurJ [Burkholderiales bacterium]MDE2158162.1 murein biosynthesis integral membrane protein MurJ [Burkholderiales bacterium]MDE2504890.1 murein biosynthesis integral membrane protein MurJ [Burkholderiales bacterium]
MNLLKTASTVSLLTLLSRVAGLVRDTLVAAIFGASAVTDAFNVAFRIPNLFRRLFAEGAFSQAFVPLLAATREREGDDATRLLINAVATVLAWVLVGVCIAGVVGAPLLVWMMGSGLARFDAAVVMTRWMFPYIGLMSMVALAGGVLNTWKRFAVPAVTPVLLNVGIISCAWLGVPWLKAHGLEPIYALAAGVMVGGLLQALWQLPALTAIGCAPRIGWSPRALRAAWHHPGVRRILRKMGPALLGVSVAQISLLINTQIATHIGVGAVTWLGFTDRLMEFPTGLLGVALGVVLLPQLAAAKAREDAAGYSGMLDWGLRLIALSVLPCALALLIFPVALVSVLFHYGHFSAHDVLMTARSLRGYGVGLIGIVALKVLAPAFYARQDMRTPVKVAVGVLVATQAMNLVFVPRLGHAGLTLSIALGALMNSGLLLALLLRQGTYAPQPGWGRFGLRLLAGNAVAAAILWLAATDIDWIGLRAHPAQRVGWVALTLVGVALAYLGVMIACGLRPRDFVRRG